MDVEHLEPLSFNLKPVLLTVLLAVRKLWRIWFYIYYPIYE